MLRWISKRFTALVERVDEREIERLIQKTKALKAELERLNGGKPIVLPEEDLARLRKAAEKIDPEVLKKICVIDLDAVEVDSDESRQNSSSTSEPMFLTCYDLRLGGIN